MPTEDGDKGDILVSANGRLWQLKSAGPDYQLFNEAFGSTLKGSTVGLSPNQVTTNAALGGSVARFTAVYLPKSAPITGVAFISGVAGVFTGNNVNGLCLYAINNGTLTKVAETANAEAVWKNAANTLVKAAFASQYTANPGFYWVGALYCNSAQTTAPSLRSAASVVTGIPTLDFANSVKIYASLAAQITLPAAPAMSALTVQLTPIAFWLY